MGQWWGRGTLLLLLEQILWPAVLARLLMLTQALAFAQEPAPKVSVYSSCLVGALLLPCRQRAEET